MGKDKEPTMYCKQLFDHLPHPSSTKLFCQSILINSPVRLLQHSYSSIPTQYTENSFQKMPPVLGIIICSYFDLELGPMFQIKKIEHVLLFWPYQSYLV